MAKVYYRKYKVRIDRGEITVEEAIELVGVEVPERWRESVIELLTQDEPEGE